MSPTTAARIAGAEALGVAQADALLAYRDLSPYRIQVVLEADGWHVDYELKDPRHKGGGPRYVIDTRSLRLTQRCTSRSRAAWRNSGLPQRGEPKVYTVGLPLPSACMRTAPISASPPPRLCPVTYSRFLSKPPCFSTSLTTYGW